MVVVKRRVARLGAERLTANHLRFKTVSEAFGGVKELKVYGREAYFLKGFLSPSKTYSDNTVSSNLISYLPRFVIESLAFGGILAILLGSILLFGFAKVIDLLDAIRAQTESAARQAAGPAGERVAEDQEGKS